MVLEGSLVELGVGCLSFFFFFYNGPNRRIGGTLIGENGLVVLTGAESVQWYQSRLTSTPSSRKP
jgi:hypothetical protein